MGAPKGNQFWKLRSKHGRDKLFETPNLLWDAACEYFEWCDENPFIKSEAKVLSGYKDSGSIEIAELPVLRPYTIQGLCLYLNCNTFYINHFEDALKDKNDQLSQDFSQILTCIRGIIYNQKFSGAASGFFNANIIARDLGLADKKDIERRTTKVDFKDAG